MLALYATHPRWPKVRLRVVAYRPQADGRAGVVKLVVQATDNGIPVAEDPLAAWLVQEREAEQFIQSSRADGWTLETDREEAERCRRYRQDGRTVS